MHVSCTARARRVHAREITERARQREVTDGQARLSKQSDRQCGKNNATHACALEIGKLQNVRARNALLKAGAERALRVIIRRATRTNCEISNEHFSARVDAAESCSDFYVEEGRARSDKRRACVRQ